MNQDAYKVRDKVLLKAILNAKGNIGLGHDKKVDEQTGQFGSCTSTAAVLQAPQLWSIHGSSFTPELIH